MDMREIEAFLAVAEELHFGRAARRLRLSTSRVSGLVRTLERRVGAPLFERTSRRVHLTAKGELFLAEVRPAYRRLNQALHSARDPRSRCTSRLVVEITPIEAGTVPPSDQLYRMRALDDPGKPELCFTGGQWDTFVRDATRS
ncbi:LysR family transcriptional regulator [Nonomuraea sp. NPDC050783]|uniref:LysR family transcriptional regulator n=1 Tax=Nonomuraea sp. NPDC050783 TaxID=3154634 RepID=UPI0034660014